MIKYLKRRAFPISIRVPICHDKLGILLASPSVYLFIIFRSCNHKWDLRKGAHTNKVRDRQERDYPAWIERF